MKLNDIEVVRELFLEREVLGDVSEGAGGAEGGAVFETEVFLEVEGGDFAEAGDESLALGGGGGIGVDLFGGVVADVLEAVVGVGDEGEVGEEVGSGEVGGGFGGGDGGEFRDGEGGGGGGPPGGPGGRVGGVGVVEDGREALDGVGIGGGVGVGVGFRERGRCG